MKESGCLGFIKRFRLGLLAVAAVLVSLTLLLPTLCAVTTARCKLPLPASADPLPDGFFLYQLLEDRGIRVKSITPAKDSMIIHVDTPEQAQAAQLMLQHHLPEG
ncbi:modulator protein [Sodalis-like symbiont of Bactericera trigonica]|nr:modulator protein [Sodalis-like symbiont of Bactericera trigonica]